MRPLVVIEGRRELFDHAVAQARAAGWQVEERFDIAGGVPDGARLVCAGELATLHEAQHAVLSAVRGAGVIAFATASRDTIDQLCDDLRRLGPLEHLTGAGPLPPSLDHDEREILALLMDGLTLGDAAKQLHLSRRTADRRLAAARATLGVRTTAEALVAARLLGVRGQAK